MEKTLIFILWLDDGKTMNLSIPNPRDGLTENEVYKAMIELLKRRCLLSENGAKATGYKKAYLRIVDEQALP